MEVEVQNLLLALGAQAQVILQEALHTHMSQPGMTSGPVFMEFPSCRAMTQPTGRCVKCN